MPAREADDLLDIKQAAQFLKVSETSLRRWTNAGRLASLRIGRRRERRFRRSDLVAFLEHHPGGHEKPKIPSPSPGTHLCGLYASEEGRTDLAATFITAGLRPGTVTLLIATPDAQRHILARLEQALGYPVEAEVDAGRLVVREYAATVEAQLEFFQSWAVESVQAGIRFLRVIGDVSGGPLGKGKSEIDKYESQYHRLIARRYPTVTLCQYDARAHSGSELLGVLRNHGDIFSYPVETLLA